MSLLSPTFSSQIDEFHYYQSDRTFSTIFSRGFNATHQELEMHRWRKFISITVFRNVSSHFISSKKNKLTSQLGIHTEYSANRDEKSRKFTRNYMAQLYKEKMKYDRKKSGFAPQPLMFFEVTEPEVWCSNKRKNYKVPNCVMPKFYFPHCTKKRKMEIERKRKEQVDLTKNQ